MRIYVKKYLTVSFLFSLVVFFQTENAFGYQINKPEITKLRKLFTEAIKQEFEVVKDIVDSRPIARGGGVYWLVHVKPKHSGQFALKYSFKFTHKFSHPEEGENEIFIRVGAKDCNRYNYNNSGIGNFCLGDTVIIPIQINQATAHQFSLKSTLQDGESIGKAGQNSKFFANISITEQVNNPLENHLKYLGSQRSEMPHRNYGAATIVYTAFFEAKTVGRFNLGLTTKIGNGNSEIEPKMNALDGLPIIILNPKTPITALIHEQNTINYSDNKRFSGHASESFLTRLLIIQPGDVFAVEYSRFTKRWGYGEKPVDTPDPKLSIHKLSFAVDKNWSYNEWIINDLPVEK